MLLRRSSILSFIYIYGITAKEQITKFKILQINDSNNFYLKKKVKILQWAVLNSFFGEGDISSVPNMGLNS